MIPAAPLVGAVTTLPPAAFSLVHRHRPQIDPVHHRERVGQIRLVAVANVGGDLRRAALDLQPAGQDPRAAAARIDRRVHRTRDRIEPRLDLFEAAVRKFILEHHFGEAFARRRAHFEQVGARGEGEGQFDLILGAAAVAPRLILIDDEAAADREIHALGEDFAIAVARGETHGIAVERLALAHLEMQVAFSVESARAGRPSR
jgi:hypothetical protein